MKVKGIMVLVLGLLFFVASAQADVILDFNLDASHPAAANISFAGGANPLTGVFISVDSVLGLGTPLNDGVMRDFHSAAAPFGAILTFTTGNFTGPGVDEWLFSGGGSISLVLPTNTGSITLLSGVFTEAEVDVQATNNFKVVIASFLDIKDPELAAFYGLLGGPDQPYSGNMNLSFNAPNAVTPNAFSSDRVLSGDITNSPVPEPMSLILLGCGLVGFGFYRRFRKP